MKTIRISDITLATDLLNEKSSLTFREKIEISKLLDRLQISAIELGALTDSTADTLLIKSVVSSVNDSVVAVCPGFESDTIKNVFAALKDAKKPRLQVCAAVSTARMEYVYHKKGDGMLETVKNAVTLCKSLCGDVEFIAEDATRADFDFLVKMANAAAECGADTVTLCDTAGVMLPDEFGEFVLKIRNSLPQNVALGVNCSNHLLLANALAVAAIKNGADEIKAASVGDDCISLSGLAKLFSAKSDSLGAKFLIRTTEINRVIKEIAKPFSKESKGKSPFEDGVRSYNDTMSFTKDSSEEVISSAVEKLGYVLDYDDRMRVYKAFCDIAQRKDAVSIGELDAIIASEAMQVPPTYTIESFVVTTSNTIDILAHIKLRNGDTVLDGLSLGDGPIDAAFLAIEKITGHHYELDDFQIQAVTQGREAMGQTIVKLRSNGKVYSGRGISTDIIGSGVAAYVNALNKIIYEEENA